MSDKSKIPFKKKVDRFFGRIICLIIILLKKFGKRREIKRPKKILIYKLNAIGDAVLCLPMIRELKRKTNAQINVICVEENKDIFLGHSFIDNVFLFKLDLKSIKEIRSIGADVAIDTGQSAFLSAILSNITSSYSIGFKNSSYIRSKSYDKSVELNPKRHMLLNYFDLAESFKIRRKINLEKLYINRYSEEKINELIYSKKWNDDRLIGLYLCSNLSYKKLSKKISIEIIKFLSKNNKIILMGSSKEKDLNEDLINSLDISIKKNVFNSAGLVNISEAIALVSKLDLFIGLDGGLMHIASAMNVPTIGLFGHETPIRYAPIGKKSVAIYKNLSCSPCNKSYEYIEPKCINPTCINKINIKDIKEAIKFLKSKK